MTSTEQGTTCCQDRENKVTSANGTGYIAVNTGTYGIFPFGLTFPNDRGTDDGISMILFKLPIPSPLINSGGGSSTTKYFKMVGFYVIGAVYESFVVTGTPASPTTNNPNTGHILVNTFVSSFWVI